MVLPEYCDADTARVHDISILARDHKSAAMALLRYSVRITPQVRIAGQVTHFN